MVVTPDHRALEPTAPLSPLLLAHPSPKVGPASGGGTPSVPPLRKNSTGSFSKLSEFWLDGTPSVPGTPWEEQKGLSSVPNVALSIDASEWRHPVFKTKVLSILRRLNVPMWTHPSLTPSSIHLQKVSGAMTNAVFFVTFNPNPVKPTSPSMSPLLTPTMPPTDPDHPPALLEDQYPPTLLFRIYGPSSDMLISRDEELRILHVLSTTYGLGPRVYGTFLNGRVEQFFPSRALTAAELRVPVIAHGIARRMRELHSVDLSLLGYQDGTAGHPMVWKSISEWIPLAAEVLNQLTAIGGRWEVFAEKFQIHKLRDEVEAYRTFVTDSDAKGKGVVFAHNDTQYGNLLLLDAELPKGVPPHHKYIVIDFEYAAPNCRGLDIANHFHEWRANYHHETRSYSLKDHYGYPTLEERLDWYRAYLSIEMSQGEQKVGKRADVAEERVQKLEREVRVWSPASSAFWSVWGLISAEEQVGKIAAAKGGEFEPEFDYLQYAMERLDMFREEARGLGVKM